VRVVITLSVVAAVIALIAAVVFLYVRWYVLQTASGRGRSGELGFFDNPLAHPISSVPREVYQLHSVKSEAR